MQRNLTITQKIKNRVMSGQFAFCPLE
jgi:hypothetical protein